MILNKFTSNTLFSNYMSQARGVGIGHLRNHFALAKKMNDYLKSGLPDNDPGRAHAAKMDDWLGILETQVAASTPR